METTITADLEHGEELAITKRSRKGYAVPAFDCFGGNTYMKTRVPAFKDLYIVFRNLSKTAHWMWWDLIQNRNPATNEVVFEATDNLEAKKVAKAYKELRDSDLVRRIRRQHYLINPKAVLPVFENFRMVTDKWDNLKNKQSVEQRAAP